MFIIDDFLLGVLSSALVSYADRLDREGQREPDVAKRFREASERLRTPTEKAQILLSTALRDQGADSSSIAKVAEAIAYDPVRGHELAEWMLDPDPDGSERKRRALARRLAEMVKGSVDEIGHFLEEVYERVNTHPELASLRSDGKLSLVLARLSELADLGAVVERHQVYVARSLRDIMARERLQHLVPVCPTFRPPRLENGLLLGNRPSDDDMDEDLDFRRKVFPGVMTAVREATRLPTALVFLADPQRGKTTFLKRVGWELAREGYPVVQLQAGSKAESYAGWLIEGSRELADRPLVVLIDDPHTDREHFESQMVTLSDRGPRVICLIASRRLDWSQIDIKRAPLLREAQEFTLDPHRDETSMALEKLIRRGILHVAPERQEALIQEIEDLPFGQNYFHDVLRIASDNRFKSTPVLVEESLAAASGSADALAFERFYGLVCLFGMVGIPLPEEEARSFLPDSERFAALQFSKSLATPPIRWEQELFMPTHEAHAAHFLEKRDLRALLEEVLEHSLEHGEIRNIMGQLLAVLGRRGYENLAVETWKTCADSLPADYWECCSASALSFSWCGFFFLSDLPEMSLQVTTLAAERHINQEDQDELGEAQAVAVAIFTKALILVDQERSEEALEDYDAVVERFGEREETDLVVANALFHKGLCLGGLERFREEIETYDALVERFGQREETALAEPAANALLEKSYRLVELERFQEAIETYDALVERFDQREESSFAEHVAKALFNKGLCLGGLERFQEEIEAYDALVERFGQREETALAEWVARALLNKGVGLGTLDRTREAIETYDVLVERFDQREESSFAEHVARALVNKGVGLGTLDRTREAIETYDVLVERFGEREETVLAERVARALFNKGYCLGTLERSQEAIEIYDVLIERFGDCEEATLAEQVARALFDKGHHLMEVERFEEAASVYEQYASKTGRDPREVYNYACLLALRGDHEAAFTSLGACLVAETISIDHVLEDGDWEELRTHPDYLALVERFTTPAGEGAPD